jgi:hypothetical protein
MTETYSLARQGFLASNHTTSAKPNYTLPDSIARQGAMHNAMMRGTQFLVLQPDGSYAWMVLDAERSTMANPVLRRV